MGWTEDNVGPESPHRDREVRDPLVLPCSQAELALPAGTFPCLRLWVLAVA